jgi:hypothetical protein
MAKIQRDAQSNRLLGAMETASRKQIEPHLESIKLKLGDIVCEAGGPPQARLFPAGRRPLAAHCLGRWLRD